MTSAKVCGEQIGHLLCFWSAKLCWYCLLLPGAKSILMVPIDNIHMMSSLVLITDPWEALKLCAATKEMVCSSQRDDL